MPEPLSHDEIMATVLVTDPSGNLWALPKDEAIGDNLDLVAASAAVPSKYAHILSAAIGLYHINFYAGQMIEAHVAALENAGMNEIADAFVQMAANLQFTRRMATEGLANLTAKKDR